MQRLVDHRWSRAAATAPLLDAACLTVFVLMGRESHGEDGGPAWFLAVAWPFLAGWFAAALLARLYTARTRVPARLAVTIVLGVAAALTLRATVTQRPTPVAFVVVAIAFVTALTVGWRLAAGLVLARRGR